MTCGVSGTLAVNSPFGTFLTSLILKSEYNCLINGVSELLGLRKSMKSAIDDLIPLDMSLLVNVCKSSSPTDTFKKHLDIDIFLNHP